VQRIRNFAVWRIVFLAFLTMASTNGIAQGGHDKDRVDLSVVQRIKTEAFEHSKVMDTLSMLTDRYGPRLTGTQEVKEAGDWTVSRLKEFGLQNVHMEPWGPFGRSWELQEYSVEMMEPRYSHLRATPLAWTRATAGPVTGEPILTPIARTYSPKRAQENLDKFIATYHGKLSGKIVLLSDPDPVPPAAAALFKRDSDSDLADLAKAPTPAEKMQIDMKNLQVPDDPQKRRQFFNSLSEDDIDKIFDAIKDTRSKLSEFLVQEGVLAALTSDVRATGGLTFAEQAVAYEAKYPLAIPMFSVTREQYNRIARLLAKKQPVKLRVNLKATATEKDVDSFNIIGEIPGGAKKDEIIMIGAHFDSWHGATGATDNGAGSAVMIEVMRILQALNLKMDRTVRIGLWTGEEEGLLGSKAYVKQHFGDPITMKITPEQAKLAGYFNLDNGAGEIRGAYLQGNDMMRPIFEEWLAPFRDLGTGSMTIRNTGGTDHLSFDAVGLPGFQFIQDDLDYMTVTHHSDMDTYDHAPPADMMQCSAVIASVVYNAANRSEMLPRKPLPQPQKVEEGSGN
jgi:carboxypeptidase Q